MVIFGRYSFWNEWGTNAEAGNWEKVIMWLLKYRLCGQSGILISGVSCFLPRFFYATMVYDIFIIE